MLLVVGCAGPRTAPPPEDEGAPKVAESALPAVAGHVSVRYRGRFTEGDSDHDLYTTVYADVGEQGRDDWTYHLLGTVIASLDARERSDEVFFSLDDTRDGRVQGRVYHAYAHLHPADSLASLRLGRQLDYDTPVLAWFDGASVESTEFGERRVSGGAYGGLPVHTYESSVHGDGLLGVWAQTRPWHGGRLRLDYMHIADEYMATDEVDDLFSVNAWQSIGGAASVEGDYTHLNGEPRDARLTANLLSSDQATVVRASVYRLLETQTQRVIELDPFYESLLELFPYTQARLLASRSFGDTWLLEGGFDLRRVDDKKDVGQFNHDFDRLYATGTVFEGLPLDIEASVTVDSYDARGNDVRSFGADLTKASGERDEVSLGTYYSLFKYDVFQDEERDNVRTWYLRVRRRPSKKRTIDVRYEYENSDQGEFHTLRLGSTWKF
jgi:hypothetical protein